MSESIDNEFDHISNFNASLSITESDWAHTHHLYDSLQHDLSIKKTHRTSIPLDAVFYIDFPGGRLFREGRFFCNIIHPYFIGISLIYGQREDLTYTLVLPEGQHSVKKIDADKALLRIDEKNLHRDVAHLLASRVNRLLVTNNFFSQAKSYEKIREAIYYIDLYEKNSNAIISDRILDLTGLSRSWVMTVLSELKRGGYINVVRGVLIGINRKLPAEF